MEVPAGAAWIRSLVWEFPYAMDAAEKEKKNKKYHALCMGMRWGKEQIDILAKSVQIKGFESDCSNSSCSRTETPSTSFMFTDYITLNQKDTVTCLRLAQ